MEENELLNPERASDRPRLRLPIDGARARRWASAFALLILVWAAWPLQIVPPGFRGVKVTLGKPSVEVCGEGPHLLIPFVQHIALMDVRVTRNEGQGEAASSDLQAVQEKVILDYHLDPRAAARAYTEIAGSTEDVAARIIDPARPEAVKSVTARYTAEELITRRTEVRDRIAAQLGATMLRHGLVLDEFAIVNFAFSPSFSAAIDAKVRAEQKKLEADRDLQRIRVEAEQRVAAAQAEADSLRLQREQVTPLLLELRHTENERRAIAKWNGQLPGTLLGGAALPFLNLGPAQTRPTNGGK